VLGQFLDLKAGDHEFATFTVNVAQVRCLGNDSFKPLLTMWPPLHPHLTGQRGRSSTWTVVHLALFVRLTWNIRRRLPVRGCMSSVRVLSIVVLGGLLGVCSVTFAQSLWMFRQSSCNVVAFDITHFRDVDGDEVLAKIARMPIREWNYKAQDAAIRHMGPTAQDFHAAFRLGEDPLAISTIDADGVALSAIQALEVRTRTQHERMLEDTQSLADQNDSLVQENAERIAEIATLKADIATLRAAMAALRGARR
jgi:hypothetical protein